LQGNILLENLSTKNKTFLFIFIILSLLLSSILFFIYTQEQSRIHDIKILNINKIQSSYDKNIVTHLEDFYIQKGELLLSPKVIDAVYKKDRLALEQLIENNYNDLKLEDIYLQQVHFHLSDGTSLYRAHNPQNFGDNIAKLRSMVTIVHQEQKIVSGFDAGKAGLTFRVFLPIFKEKVYIGALEIGVSAEKLLDVVSYFNNIDALIYMEKSKLQKDSKEIVYTNVKNKEILKRLPKDFDIEDELTIDIDGKYIFAYSIDMKDFNNDTIGKFIFFEDLTKEYTYFYNTIKQISFIFIVISVSLFIIINYTFSKLIGTLDKTKLFTDSILDNSAHAIIATDTKGIITLFNKKAQTMLGFSEEELVGKLTPIIFHKQEEMEEKL
jgi:PAS domain-containing protein